MDSVLSELKNLSATTVSDALDRLGIGSQCLGIKPLAPEFRLCGRAFTMRTVPVVGEPGSVGDYIDDVPEGEVVVMKITKEMLDALEPSSKKKFHDRLIKILAQRIDEMNEKFINSHLSFY